MSGPDAARGRQGSSLTATPVRQFQVVALLTLAVFAWVSLYISAARHVMPRGGLVGTLADVTAGGLGERWYSFVVAALYWGHAPALYLLAGWGLVLAVRTVATYRPATADQDPRAIPIVLLFWGAVALAGACRAVAGFFAATSSFLGSEYFGVAFGAFWVWIGVAVLALGTGIVGAVLRRRERRERARRRREGAERKRASRQARKRPGRQDGHAAATNRGENR
ncbi:hypothetical protein [Georgenia subflava]|uniref:Uncharacterized protein n=1 Tax=Georgenia subflava TaxID=1622177 RepID=A0A6N7EJF2_9MICO|nr:hypothetical protein [Georgenia subflava]MPV37178.1 hypothetical protein [Georgenia subflava]